MVKTFILAQIYRHKCKTGEVLDSDVVALNNSHVIDETDDSAMLRDFLLELFWLYCL